MLLALILWCTSLLAQPDWIHSYTQAREAAKNENKHIMIMLSKEGCSACWYMENIVFEDDSTEELVMKNFVPVYIDIRKNSVPKEFAYIGTPTFYFLDKNGNKIAPRMDGASNIKEFTSKINEILLK